MVLGRTSLTVSMTHASSVLRFAVAVSGQPCLTKPYRIMKRILLLLVFVCLLIMTSCSKEFTYGIRNETGTTRDVYIYEYNKDNEAIVIHNSIVENRITKLYDAHRNTVKIKIYIKNLDMWLQQVFYLERSYTEITINAKTVLGNEKP